MDEGKLADIGQQATGSLPRQNKRRALGWVDRKREEEEYLGEAGITQVRVHAAGDMPGEPGHEQTGIATRDFPDYPRAIGWHSSDLNWSIYGKVQQERVGRG